jgi:hypothetical protein
LLEDRTVPSFVVPASLAVGVNPQAVAVGDFTGTGIPELVVANHDSGTVSVFLGNGDGTFQPAQNYTVGGTPVSVAVGDLNNDGKLDIVTANDNNGTVSVLLGNGGGTFQPSLDYLLPGTQTPHSVAVGDFNKDGELDVAVTANTYTPGTPGYGDSYSYIPGTPAQYNGYVNVLIGNGAGGFSGGNSYALTSGIPGSVAVGDFRGNGNLDLAVAEPALNTVSVLLGNGSGTFGNPADYVSGSWTNPQSAAVGDFNGDGKLDLVMGNSGSNTVSVLLGNGDGTFGTAANYTTPGTTNSVAVADFNRDGKLDLEVSGSYGVTALLGMGDGTFATAWSYAASGFGPLAVGDFNRDGWPDLATANPNANSVSVLRNAADWSTAPQASSFVVSGFPSPTIAGTPGSFTITARKADGTTATNYTGTVHFTSSDPQAVLPADYTFTSADAGVHTFSAVLKTAGTQSLTAHDTLSASITATQAGITVSPAAAVSAFRVAGLPSPMTAGSAGTFTVTALDAYGNRTGYLGTVHFTSSDPQAVLPANYTFTTADAGMHTFSATLKTAYYSTVFYNGSGQSLTATDMTTASITGTQSGITVNPGAATMLVFLPNLTPWPLGQPAPGYTAGRAWQFEFRAMDSYGNIATGYTGTVHFTSSDTQAVLPPDHTFTARDAGDYSFSATFNTAGTQSITVTDTTTASITGSDVGLIVVSQAAARKFIVSAPRRVTAGTPFSLTVEAVDANGNVVASYAGTIHFTSSDGTATLPNNYTFTAADKGVHTFSGLVLRKRGYQKITITDTLNGSLLGSVIVDVL